MFLSFIRANEEVQDKEEGRYPTDTLIPPLTASYLKLIMTLHKTA